MHFCPHYRNFYVGPFSSQSLHIYIAECGYNLVLGLHNGLVKPSRNDPNIRGRGYLGAGTIGSFSNGNHSDQQWYSGHECSYRIGVDYGHNDQR